MGAMQHSAACPSLHRRVWIGVLIDGTLRTYELGRLAVNALEHGGLVVDVGFLNETAILTNELVVHVVAAHVVLDRLVAVLVTRASLLCMSYDTTPSPYAMI